MRRGDYLMAWAISDRVLAARDPVTRDDPSLPYHLRWVWDGRPYHGRHVLIRCYHGLGDTLQFARYLPALRPHVASLTVEAQPELHGLLVGTADRLLPFVPSAPSPPSECDLEIMELPHAMRLPPRAVAPLRVGDRAFAPAGPGTIGVCWQSGGWDTARSVPSALVAALVAVRAAVALQPAPTDLAVLNPAGCPSEIARTAALISGLDLVITVDTMVAHLAGTLNRPTWLLLKHAADWRWMEDRADSPWYRSMRLYRQPAPGDWDAVMARVADDLAAT